MRFAISRRASLQETGRTQVLWARVGVSNYPPPESAARTIQNYVIDWDVTSLSDSDDRRLGMMMVRAAAGAGAAAGPNARGTPPGRLQWSLPVRLLTESLEGIMILAS